MIESKELTKKSMYDTVMQQFDKTADAMNLNPNIRKILAIK